MVAETRLFGTVDIAEDKILEFPMGLIGFENLKKFAIIYDSDREVRSKISWLQSMEEPALALPIIHPSELIDDYGPIVEDELMKNIGDPADADILMFVTLSIPRTNEDDSESEGTDHHQHRGQKSHPGDRGERRLQGEIQCLRGNPENERKGR